MEVVRHLTSITVLILAYLTGTQTSHGADIILPVAVTQSSGAAYPSPDGKKYAAEVAIDGDSATFCCLLDDTTNGTSDTTIPARAAAPVTGHLVFDLGARVRTVGVRLVARADGGPFNPKQVDFFCFADDDPRNNTLVDDLENDDDLQPLQHDFEFPPLRGGASHTVQWQGVDARYVGLRIRSSYESGGKHFNFQIGEIEFLVELNPKAIPPGLRGLVRYEKQDSLPETLLALRQQFTAEDGSNLAAMRLQSLAPERLGKLWERVRRDFPPSEHRLLDYVHHDWFSSDGWLTRTDTELEQRLIRRAAEETSEAGRQLRDELQELIRTDVSAADRRWLDLCVKAAELVSLIRQSDQLAASVEHLGELFPDRYPVMALRQSLDDFRRRVVARFGPKWNSRDAANAGLWQELESMQREMLVNHNPLLAAGKIVFVKRHTYRTGWYYAEFMQAGPPGGNLCVLDLTDGSVRELLPDMSAGLFDRYDLSFDGRRVVFGYRPKQGQAFRLYEVGIDGTGLRQITTDPPNERKLLASYGLDPTKNELGPWRGHTDDFHPCYLPDGSICFASSRCQRGVLCDQGDRLSVNVLYRVDADGRNMQILSEGALSESTPSVMNDGRILYTRWEYVDKGVIAVQALWAMRPDATGSCEVYGNHHEFPPVLIHGRAIPGHNNLFVATATMHHPFAVGPILLLDTSKDIRTHAPIRSLTPDTGLSIDGVGGFPRGENYTHLRNGQWVKDNCGPLFCDPYPLADPESGAGAGDYFLVSCNPDRPWNDSRAYAIYLIDTFGNRVEVYDDPDISCWQPIPLRPRPCPQSVLSPPTHHVPETSSGEATIVLADVYQGLEGVERGTVKYLRILEQVARPWSAHRFWPDDATLGQNAVISMYAHIFVKIHHGVVPVHEDGSAYFTVPADKNIFFQALDKDFMEVQRMRTFVNFQPGESRSCIGCHEPQSLTPFGNLPLALHDVPSKPSPQPGETVPRTIHYPADVQPVLDRHCVECHRPGKTEGGLDLTGELTTFFNRSYENLMRNKWVTYIQEFQGPQPRAQKSNVEPLPPRALGSHASRLIRLLRQGHYDVKLSTEEMVRIITWADANSPYYGSYFGRRNLKYRDLPDFRPPPTLESASGIPPEYSRGQTANEKPSSETARR